jgi:hypothetical protein
MFPIMLTIYEGIIGICNAWETGIAPLNSIKGTIEIKKIHK